MTCPTCDGWGEIPVRTLAHTIDGCAPGGSWVPEIDLAPCTDCTPAPRTYPPDPVFGQPEEDIPCQFPAA